MSSKYRIAVIGSRDYPNRDQVTNFILENFSPDKHVLVSGGARGVDTWAELAAEAQGIETDIFYADWDKHGKQAGILRNIEMVDTVDGVIAFSIGTPGTNQALKYANAKRRIPILVFGPEGYRFGEKEFFNFLENQRF